MASVDIAVTCYQYGRFLRDCVTSVLSQDFQDLRVLIIDNASTDNSVEVARALAAEDRRVQVVAHQTNLGHHASFNEGIDWASSDYFMMLCADDLLAPGCLSRAVSFMEVHPDVILTYGRTLFVNSGESIPAVDHTTHDVQWRVMSGRKLLERFCRTGRGIPGPIVLVRTSAQKKAGYYRSELPHTDDFELSMRLACLGNAAETDAVQGIIRCHPMNRSARLSDDALIWDYHCEAAFESFFTNEGSSPRDVKCLHQTARRNLAERAYWAALSNLARGDIRRSLDHWKFAFSRRPTTILLPPVGYLFRRERAFSRIIQVISEAVRRPTKKKQSDS
jgi:glycosyltransferase involved in cell wall biosynthesis